MDSVRDIIQLINEMLKSQAVRDEEYARLLLNNELAQNVAEGTEYFGLDEEEQAKILACVMARMFELGKQSNGR